MPLHRIGTCGTMFRHLTSSLIFSRKCHSTKNHYAVLEVDKDASPQEIKEAFHKKAKQFHPDSSSIESQRHDPDRFVELNNAYSVLSSPILRRQYDEKFKEKDSWSRHTQPPPRWEFHDDHTEQDYEQFYNTSHTPKPPKWIESFKRKRPHYEEDFQKLSFWQNHWSGVILFIFIQLHVFAMFYHFAERIEQSNDMTWYYDNMTAEEFETYINIKEHRYDHVGDVFSPPSRKRLEEKERLLEKLHPIPTSGYRLNYISQNFKQLKLPPDLKPSVDA